MRTIQRDPTPGCLAKQPTGQDWASFMGSPCHSSVHNGLRHEQQGLCCYCETEIRTDDGHIDHMEPRNLNPGRTYEYTNMALSCDGGAIEHCGRYKDDEKRNPDYDWDSTRFVSPHDPQAVRLFEYLRDGSITPTNLDPDKANYLIDYLGLNCVRLTQRRRGHARALFDAVGDDPDSDVLDSLRQEYLDTDKNGWLKRFYSLSKAILDP